MKILPLVITGIIVLLGITSSVVASTNESVTATTKIGVCGDEKVGGGEECDNSDLSNETCTTLGYLSGALSCDPACEFDVSECIGIAVATPTPTATPVSASSSDLGSVTSPTSATTPQPQEPSLFLVRIPALNETFSKVLNYDSNGDGKLSLSELREISTDWVNDARSIKDRIICDFNYDSQCNLTDFSVLMYYIER